MLSTMSEYQLFLAFERGDYINLKDLPSVTNYICGHLNSWSPNRSYFEIQYNYISKLTVACNWKKKRGLPICSKKGEAICDAKLANFFEEEQHKNCSCSYV